MKFNIKREQLLKPLQQINNLLSSRPILPILDHLLIKIDNNQLLLTATNLEMQLVSQITNVSIKELGMATIPARKFFNICRNLPIGAAIDIALQKQKILISCANSNFALSSLPAQDFPNLTTLKYEINFNITQNLLKFLLEATQFSMAYQDVRHYLNGMLLEINQNQLSTVTTDGHRLSICTINIDRILPNNSIIIPRKCVIELIRLLDQNHDVVNIKIGKDKICYHINNYMFTANLIAGTFPDYRNVFPKKNKIIEIKCDLLKQAFIRVAILANQKFYGVNLHITQNKLIISSTNVNQDRAEETLDIIYDGDDLKISFNVNYIIDILNTLKCKYVKLFFTDSNSSIQIENQTNSSAVYLVMPIRL